MHVQTILYDQGYQGAGALSPFSVTTTAGNMGLLYAIGGTGTSAPTAAPTDNKSDTWSKMYSNTYNGGGYTATFWLCSSLAGGTTNPVFVVPSGGPLLAGFTEFSGRLGTLDSTMTPIEITTSPPYVGNSFTPSSGSDIFVFLSGSYFNASASYTAGSGFTIPVNGTVPGTDFLAAVEYQNAWAGGALTPTITANTNDVMLFAFSFGAAPTGPAGRPIRMYANGQYFANSFVEGSTDGRMKQYSSNGTVQILNMVESIGIMKFYANGTFSCNNFSEI